MEYELGFSKGYEAQLGRRLGRGSDPFDLVQIVITKMEQAKTYTPN